MTKVQLYKALDYANHSREKRMEMALLISENPHLIDPLFEIATIDDSQISSRACWILEFTARENLPFIFPHLNTFTGILYVLKRESSIRPIAKICELLMLAYFKEENHTIKKVLTEDHLEKITAACFDWLIGKYKVAPKAYSMTSLFLLGTKYDWIHPELKMILEQNFADGSAAYKARARMTLSKIKASCWLLVVGCWLLVVGCWLLVNKYLLNS